MRSLKLFFASLAVVFSVSSTLAQSPLLRSRTPVDLPEVPGYVTLKCDFHIHTVFSDGLVWPTVRVEEAWRQGLDGIAITDHLEYQPHQADVTTNHDRSFEVAQPAGANLGILVMKGAEITREMPPGHINAIFLTNTTPLATRQWRDAVKAAKDQGAFIMWNHPGWSVQLKDNKTQWFPEHTELFTNGMLHGIEVVNGGEYYPEAHRWAIEKKLAMFSDSDIHNPLNFDYDVAAGDHRPMTLVFARERSLEAVKEALFARQTVVYSRDLLVGDESFLRPIFNGAVEIKNAKLSLRSKQRVMVQVHNHSEVALKLQRAGTVEELEIPDSLVVPGHRTVLMTVRAAAFTKGKSRQLKLPYKVTNLLIGPDQPLPVTLNLNVDFVADAKQPG